MPTANNTLSNNDIINILTEKKILLNGCMMSNYLPKQMIKGPYVINLDKKGNGGTHWTALYYGGKDGKHYYFDSMGVLPPEDLENKIKNYVYNDKQFQCINDTSCGFYCIAFIMNMHHLGATDETFKKFRAMFKEYPNNKMNETVLNKIVN